MAGHCPESRGRDMKNEKSKDKDKARATRGARVPSADTRNWAPLFARLRDAIEWALDIAKHLAHEIDEDVEAIERTRAYARAWLRGEPVEIDLEDVLTTLAVLFGAIELDLGIDSSPLIERVLPCVPALHLPGAELSRVVVRTPRRRRMANVFSQLAA
jgi:hypothetical protein